MIDTLLLDHALAGWKTLSRAASGRNCCAQYAALQVLPKAYGAMDLMNPSKSLLGAMRTFSSRMEQAPGPKLPTFPPFPSQTETEDILKNLMDRLESAKVRKAGGRSCCVATGGSSSLLTVQSSLGSNTGYAYYGLPTPEILHAICGRTVVSRRSST